MKRYFYFIWLFCLLVGLTGCWGGAGSAEKPNPMVSWVKKLLPKSQNQKRQELTEKLLSPDADLRREAVWTLGKFNADDLPQRTEILAKMAKLDPDYLVRTTAVQVAGTIEGNNHLTETLSAGIADKNELVRLETIKVLANQSDSAGLNMLLEILNNDSETAERRASIAAMGNYKDRRAIQALISQLDNEEFSISYQALQSLKKITEQDFGYDKQKWIESVIKKG